MTTALQVDSSETQPGQTDPVAPGSSSKGEFSTSEFLKQKLIEDGPIFEDTCHREFIYYGHTKSTSALCLSILVILAQTALYVVLLNEGSKKIGEDQVNMEVGWKYCRSYQDYKKEQEDGNSTYIDPYLEYIISEVVYSIFDNDSSLGNNTIEFDESSEYSILSQATCEAEDPLDPWLGALLPAILLAAYTMPDIINAIKASVVISGMFSKIASFIIICENVLTIIVGAYWAYQGWWKGNSYESIINCVVYCLCMKLMNKCIKHCVR